MKNYADRHVTRSRIIHQQLLAVASRLLVVEVWFNPGDDGAPDTIEHDILPVLALASRRVRRYSRQRQSDQDYGQDFTELVTDRSLRAGGWRCVDDVTEVVPLLPGDASESVRVMGSLADLDGGHDSACSWSLVLADWPPSEDEARLAKTIANHTSLVEQGRAFRKQLQAEREALGESERELTEDELEEEVEAIWDEEEPAEIPP